MNNYGFKQAEGTFHTQSLPIERKHNVRSPPCSENRHIIQHDRRAVTLAGHPTCLEVRRRNAAAFFHDKAKQHSCALAARMIWHKYFSQPCRTASGYFAYLSPRSCQDTVPPRSRVTGQAFAISISRRSVMRVRRLLDWYYMLRMKR
jgi:hypothetical protein